MILTALIFGLVSSLHCIGMCGPIAVMLPLDRQNPARKTLQLLSYHTGRLTAYGFLGSLFGIFGQGLYLAGMQQRLSVVIGAFIIAIVVVPALAAKFSQMPKPVASVLNYFKMQLGSRLRDKTPAGLFTLGILNGFLPCGLVYAALFGALAMQNVITGAVYMILFGLGTIPMMAGVSLLAVKISNPVRQKMLTLVPVTATVLGVLFILRGFGLGIPYVSPGSLDFFVNPGNLCH